MDRLIGVGWCIITQDDCVFSGGHGRDGKVICSCEGDCPERGVKG